MYFCIPAQNCRHMTILYHKDKTRDNSYRLITLTKLVNLITTLPQLLLRVAFLSNFNVAVVRHGSILLQIIQLDSDTLKGAQPRYFELPLNSRKPENNSLLR